MRSPGKTHQRGQGEEIPARLGSKRENPKGQAAPASPREEHHSHGQPSVTPVCHQGCLASLCSSSSAGHQPITNPAAHQEPRGAQEKGGRQGSSQAGCLSTAAVGLHPVSIYVLFYYVQNIEYYTTRARWSSQWCVHLCEHSVLVCSVSPALCVYIYTHTYLSSYIYFCGTCICLL